ncbi:hypothetical protein [Methylobacterium sp. Leaf99]|jgi:hypothetical protein|uniref:hypothetical protein n=1 Tax=Methylobacterium sp. Leaf99 TaxID=1736251 RepID=UPI0006FAC560|nr:hypothetical protein [Methylobacterium sp. Leaf99]
MLTILRPVVVALTLTSSAPFAVARTPEAAVPSAGTFLPTATTLLRHVAANGTTKPLGAPVDQRLGTSLHLATADMRLSRAIRAAICTGC